MDQDDHGRICSDILRSLGADQPAVEELAAYCCNPFSVEVLPSPPVLPLQDEAHVDDWRDYLDEPGRIFFTIYNIISNV